MHSLRVGTFFSARISAPTGGMIRGPRGLPASWPQTSAPFGKKTETILPRSTRARSTRQRCNSHVLTASCVCPLHNASISFRDFCADDSNERQHARPPFQADPATRPYETPRHAQNSTLRRSTLHLKCVGGCVCSSHEADQVARPVCVSFPHCIVSAKDGAMYRKAHACGS